jgi:hypothetical protein
MVIVKMEKYLEVWCLVVCQIGTNVSKELIASIFRVEEHAKQERTIGDVEKGGQRLKEKLNLSSYTASHPRRQLSSKNTQVG